MKKILSLLAMLVVTVAAMATNYTDKLVNSVRGYEATYDAATLQITDKGSGKYDVVLKDLANSELGMSFGDLTLSDVEGTTAGGYTTISVTDVTAKFTSGSYSTTSPGCSMTSVTVKFDGTKAYANYAGILALNTLQRFDFTATFGTDDFGGGETVEPVTVPYTDVAYATYNGTTTNYTGHEVDVITESDGTTTIVYKGLTAGTTTFGDLTAKNVTVTEGADGSTVYTFNGDATWSNVQIFASMLGITEGSTVALTINATAKDGEFDGTFVTTLNGQEATIVFGSSYVEPEPEPETLPLTDFLPDGATFQYPFTINWDTQKLVAKLDLTTCQENQANENLFSLSDNVDVLANWNVTDDGYLALYYTRNASLWTTSGWQNAEKRLTVHYRGAVNKNIETTIENPEEVVFEVTKDGLYAEGTQLLTAADMPKLYESNDASLFFASIQGENRSWATYKSVTIEDVEVAQPDTVAYTNVAYATFNGTTTNYTDHEIDVVTELDGTTTVIYKGLTAGDNVFGDLTAKNVTVAEGEDGAKTYTFEGDATWSNTNTLFATFGVTDGATTPLTINGTAKDGKLDATFVTTLLGSEATIVFGSSYVEPEPEPETLPLTDFLPDGATFQYPFTINWDTQKLVAKLDLTTCQENQANENLFSLSDNVDVLANWNVTDDGYLALYYTRNASLWTTSGWQNAEKRLTVHYRGAVNKNIETTIENPEEVVFEVTKDGLYAEGTQLLTAADMPKLYESNDASLFFASIQGENRSWATYKSVTIEDVEVAQPDTVAYTNVAYATFNGTTTNYTDHEIDVVTELDGTTTLVYKNFTVGSNVLGDLTAKNVTVEDAEDGSKVYTFDGEATWKNTDGTFTIFGVADDATTPLTIDAILKDGEFAATYNTTLQGLPVVVVFGSAYVDPGEGVEVIPDGYTPNGDKFNYTADIDWDKQYLEAEIDLSTCTGSNEGILSVGQSIASWSGAPHFHLYYPGSNTKGNLEINYLNADGSSPVRGHVNASGVVTITISKRTGITINDQNGNILYEDKGTFSSRDSISSIYSELWALTSIEVGSQEGSGRSHATYNSVRIYDLEEEVPVVVDEQTFTDKLELADSEGNTQTVDNATIVLRTYDDGSYDLLMEDFGYGDVVVKPVTLATEDGVTYITGETTVTVNGDEWVVAVDGMKTGTDKLVLDFEFTDPDDEEFYIEGQFGATENGIGGIEKKVSGADAIYTISGAKVNSLQKGINIVRINGKTIKVVKK